MKLLPGYRVIGVVKDDDARGWLNFTKVLAVAAKVGSKNYKIERIILGGRSQSSYAVCLRVAH